MADHADRGLKKTVTWIAAAAALSTAVVIPALYFFSAYSYEQSHLKLEVERAGAALSQRIYLNPEVWHFDTRVLAELSRRLQLGRGDRWLEIFGPDGESISVVGRPPAPPVIIWPADLSDGRETVGRVEIAMSLRPVWQRSGLAAVLGVVLGLAVFAALRVFPLRALNRALGQLEASNAELFEAQEQLVRNERLAALGQVTATVSHELRNPLGTIRTTFSTIAERTEGKGLGLERALSRVDRNIARCNDIIGDLLDFTRTRELTRQPVSVDAVLDQLLTAMDLQDRCTLRLDLASDAHASLDRERFHRVLINVVDNACQAIAGGQDGTGEATGGTITISSRKIGDRVEVSVQDNGPGMPAEVLAKVFEPLYSTKTFGVGLGLPMVRQIMERHGGGVGMTAEEGVGTKVTLWLPLAAQAMDAVA